jgi:ABC-type phosphate transport system substrate-binding protein
VLNFETIALIYLNEITTWNDERIARLNNINTTTALPNAPITVITSSASADLTYLFTTVLARTVKAFKDSVVPGYTASFPVQQAGPSRSIVVNSNEDMIEALRGNSNAFCFAYGYDITLVRSPCVRARNQGTRLSDDSLLDCADRRGRSARRRS